MDILVVTDMQKDFIDGVLGTPEAKAIVSKVKEKIKKWKKKNQLILYTADIHSRDKYARSQEGKKIKEHCLSNTEGAIIPFTIITGADLLINKETFAPVEYFYELSKERKYLDIDSFTIIGLVTNICVISIALLLRSLFPETPIIIDESCCAGTTPEMHKEALDVMRSCCIDVIGEEDE